MSSQLVWVGLRAYLDRDQVILGMSHLVTFILKKAGRNWRKVLLGLLALRIWLTRRRANRYWQRIHEADLQHQAQLQREREETRARHARLQSDLLRMLPSRDLALELPATAGPGDEPRAAADAALPADASEDECLAELSATKLATVLGLDTMRELIPLLEPMALGTGQILWAAGDPDARPGMYLVGRGRLGLFAPPHHQLLCSFARGESLCDFNLLAPPATPGRPPAPHTMSCAALAPSRVYFLEAARFAAFAGRRPEVFLQLLRTVIAREWRVASYVFDQFLSLPALNREQIQGDELTGLIRPPAAASASRSGSPERGGASSKFLKRLERIAVRSVSLPARRSVLFRAGQAAHSMFYLVKGNLRTLAPGRDEDAPEDACDGRIPEGSVVGGMSLFSGTSRGETVFAAEPCTLWEFDLRAFDQHPELLLPLMRAVGRQLAPTLRQFFELGMQPAVFSAGKTVFRQGDPARGMMLVLSGRVRAVRLQTLELAQFELWEQVQTNQAPNTYRVLFEVSRGETLGWSEAFGGDAEHLAGPGGGRRPDEAARRREVGVRHFTAVCTRDTELVTISRVSLERVFERNPAAMLRFNQQMARRLQALTQDQLMLPGLAQPDASGFSVRRGSKRFQNLAVISLIPIGRYTLSARENTSGVSSQATLRVRQASMRANYEAFALRLAAALAAHGPVLHLNKHRLALMLGPGAQARLQRLHDPLEHQRMVFWLAQQEENYRFLLLEADADWTESPGDGWTRICIGQADSVVCVASAGATDKTVSRPEQQFLWRRTRSPQQATEKLRQQQQQQAGNASDGSVPSSPTQAKAKAVPPPATLRRAGSQLRLSHHGAGLLRNSLTASPGTASPPGSRPVSAAGPGVSYPGPGESSVATSASPQAAAALTAPDLSGVDPDHLEELPFWSAAAASFRDLVILHPGSGSGRGAEELPRGTKDWFVGRQLRSHHHIRTRVDGDYERLARFFSGTSVGLVLSGGGAKGLAHLGVLKALEESGVPIDYVGGSSQGAFMGALYARYLSADRMEAPLRNWIRIFRPLGLISSLTLPILSWFDGSSMSQAIREIMGESTQIEDLWIPFFCTSTNLRQADLNIHAQGSLWFHCRASMSVVGLLPPMIDTNGDLLCDGGYASNLPADVMASRVETVIAVDVENKDVSSFYHLYNFGDGVSGWWVLWQKLTRTHRVPVFGEMVNWLSCINHTRQLISMQNQPGLIDLYIRPLVQHFGLIDYHRLDDISRIGYETATKALRPWVLTRRQVAMAPAPAAAAAAAAVDSLAVSSAVAALVAPATEAPLTAAGGLGDTVRRLPSFVGAPERPRASTPAPGLFQRLSSSSSAHNLTSLASHHSASLAEFAAAAGGSGGAGGSASGAASGATGDSETPAGLSGSALGDSGAGRTLVGNYPAVAAGVAGSVGGGRILSWANPRVEQRDELSTADYHEFRRLQDLELRVAEALELRVGRKPQPPREVAVSQVLSAENDERKAPADAVAHADGVASPAELSPGTPATLPKLELDPELELGGDDPAASSTDDADPSEPEEHGPLALPETIVVAEVLEAPPSDGAAAGGVGGSGGGGASGFGRSTGLRRNVSMRMLGSALQEAPGVAGLGLAAGSPPPAAPARPGPSRPAGQGFRRRRNREQSEAEWASPR